MKVFTAFSGYDSQCMALDRLGIDYELIAWSEIDKYAIQAHNAVYPQYADRNYGDICKIDWIKVPDFDLFTYSFPCGLAGTKVKTIQGYNNIEDVVVGDKVLTHNNRYCEVIRTMSRICSDYYNINAIGCKLKLTAEHPLYVLRDGVEQWVKVKDLQKTDKLSYCIPQGDVTLDISDKKLWLLGRYVADGFINKHLYNSVLFAICNKKEPEFLANVPCEFKDKFRKFQKSCIEYRIADKDFHDLCMEFGNGAINKHIPEWLFSANLNQIEHFLNGYFSGDGHVRYRSGNKVQMFTTVSKDLFLGLQLLILKCYGKVCSLSIRHDNRKTTFNDTYNGQISFSVSAYQKIINDKIFVSIKSIEKVENKVQVYNLEVRKDNSYTCDNVNTHNCTDISSAGQQKGLTEGSGTRSSLLWECRKAIEIKRPKYLLMENVKALTSEKFLPYLQKWLLFLESMGYSNFTKVLNSKDYGVPQNRERVFVVSIFGDERYYFPKPFKLEKLLKDVLESDVDESYYLSKKMIDTFQKRNKRNEERGNGFRFSPTNGDVVAAAVLSNAGSRDCDNYIRVLGNTNPSGNGMNGNVFDEVGIASTLTTNKGEGIKIAQYGNKRVQNLVDSGKISGDKVEYIDDYNQSVFVTEPKSYATRGRNPDNPSDRKSGIPTEQRIEIGGDIANCLTTVQKDSLVLEPSTDSSKTEYSGVIGISVHPNGRKMEFKGESSVKGICPALRATDYKCPHTVWLSNKQVEYKRGKLQEDDSLYLGTSKDFFHGGFKNISRTLKAEKHDAGVVQNYRIRKLTPRECFRLMGVSEENIDKIQNAGISKTQQYKMAGNSIVVDVLYYIFKKLFIDKKANKGDEQVLF